MQTNVATEDVKVLDDAISSEWLKAAGFKWHQLERQPYKHWLLWLGHCIESNTIGTEDLGVELGPTWWKNRNGDDVGEVGRWHCWLRSDAAHIYSRFIHVRHLRTCTELVALIEAITGQRWNPENNLYGSMMTQAQADRIRADYDRLDRQLLRDRPAWRKIEEDDSIGRPLVEHLQAHETARSSASE